ncbi:MAG: hypothetical protein DRO43_01145 [Candidatus Hecatellales archaeon]|nr:MAG: hypothetical protein DRO43_01145 [Candidatus Hecatellales archaeon]
MFKHDKYYLKTQVASMSRVTSVELDEEDVRYIENLIVEGRIRSLKEFVEKCVKFGISYTLDRWQPGVMNVGPVRVIILMKKALELLVEHVPPEDHEDVGREIGEIVSSFLLFQHQVECSQDWDAAFKILSDMGWGQFQKSSETIIQVVSPALPSEIMKGCLEAMLNVKLEAIHLKIDVHQFKVL